MSYIVPKVKPQYPWAQERYYDKRLRAHFDKLFKHVRSQIPDVAKAAADISQNPHLREFNSSFGPSTAATFDFGVYMADKLDDPNSDISKLLSLVATQTDSFCREEFLKMLHSVTGRPLSNWMEPTQELLSLQELWIEQNLNLIKKLTEETRSNLATDVVQTILSPGPKDEGLTEVLKRYTGALDDAVAARMGGVNNRISLIANDQIGSYYGYNTRYRYMDAGVDHYEWVTAGDKRVRESHRALSGKIRLWSISPIPGSAIRCRCSALPVFDTDNLAKSSFSTYQPDNEKQKFYGRKVEI